MLGSNDLPIDPMIQHHVDCLSAAFDRADGTATRVIVAKIARHLLDETDGADGYWHPLGFFRVELGFDDERRRYALHVWPERQRSTQGPAWLIHDHVWPFRSFVAVGSLIDNQYDASDDGSGRRGMLYRAELDPPRSTLVRTGQHVVLDSPRSTRVAYAFYSVAPSVFHETHVGIDSLCITTVQIGRRVRAHATIVGDLDGPESILYERMPVPAGVCRRALGELAGEGA